jgi:hypothetical protein
MAAMGSMGQCVPRHGPSLNAVLSSASYILPAKIGWYTLVYTDYISTVATHSP